MRRKKELVLIAVVLLLAVAITVGNWEYWQRLLTEKAPEGTREFPASQTPEPVGGSSRPQLPPDGIQDKQAPLPVKTSPPGDDTQAPKPEPGGLPKPPRASSRPPDSPLQAASPGAHPTSPAQHEGGQAAAALEGLAAALSRRLQGKQTNTLVRGSSGSPFVHPLELAGGVDFRDLIKTLKTRQQQAAVSARMTASQAARQAGEDAASRAAQQAARERRELLKARVTGIMKGPHIALSVVNGHPMRPGDSFRGSAWILKEVHPRDLLFKKGKQTLSVPLADLAATAAPTNQKEEPHTPKEAPKKTPGENR